MYGLSHRNAENRFRSGLIQVRISLGRTGPKSVGKHEAASESGRPPKYKIQRTTEPQEVPAATDDFLLAPGQLLASAAEFHITHAVPL